MNPAQACYAFGDFLLETGRQRLSRRDTGEIVPLTAKVFDTLVYLVEHAGEALDKDVLLRALWPGVIVEENSLAQSISTLRQALGEARGENRYIATIARKGYRFVAAVVRVDEVLADDGAIETIGRIPGPYPRTVAPAAEETHAGGERQRDADAVAAGSGLPRPRARMVMPALLVVALGVLIAFGALREPAPPSIAESSASTLAILPFKPLLPAERNASLELGMAESLIASLGQGRQSVVSPLSSVRRFAALETDPIEAGRELGVDAVLDGSLQRSGDRLRVSVRLLRVSDGQQLWTQAFDQDFTGIFEVQDAIAARVAQALPARQVAQGAARQASTRNPEAYALYTSGRFAWTRQNEASIRSAIAFFEQAIALDPDYALAYTGLADSYAVLGVFGIEAPHAVFPRARAAAQRAQSIDPDSAAAHSALGHVKAQYEHDWEGASREYERALQLDPSIALTHHRRGLLFAMQGDTERALQSAALAQEREPLWLAARGTAANYLYYARRHDESIALSEQVLALDERAENSRGFLIRALIARGDSDRALAELDKASELQMPGSHAFRAQALAVGGRREDALAELERVMALSTQRYVAAYDIALIHAALGDNERAFEWLERAMQDRSTLLVFLAQEPMLDALHADPRFAALVQRIGVYRGAITL